MFGMKKDNAKYSFTKEDYNNMVSSLRLYREK
jgi:hypothetical protein